MKLSIPEIRPRVLSADSYEILGELMGFRHVFRHTYNYNLSTEKINLLRNRIIDNFSSIENDINEFKKFLEENFR